MELGRRYANAPISQAILEFQLTTPENLRLADLARIDFGAHYGDGSPVYNLESEVKFTPDGSVNTETREHQVGFAYVDESRSLTVHAGAQRFAFVWGTQYTRWDDFMAAVEAAWLVYRRGAEPNHLQRIGIRFVNQIPMPERSIEIKDYLRMSVDIPAYLPQAVNGLFMQVDIPLPQFDAQATITSAMLRAVDQHPGGGLLLDIDVKSDVELNTSDSSFDEDLRSRLDTLRLAKNYVFEACITDATRGLID